MIKDVPFDISNLKSKRRYEINKGKKFFDVRVVEPQEYVTSLFDVTIEAISSWPEKYRPIINEEIFKEQIQGWEKAKIYGAFSKETNELCGYAVLEQHLGYLASSILRVNPKCEKQGINAAIVSFLLEDNSEKLNGNYYISDGARSIRHETAFQDYLEKYFGFRKAYCKLHIKYRGIMGIVVKTFYPLRKMIKGNGKLSSLILGVLKMEEIKRSFN